MVGAPREKMEHPASPSSKNPTERLQELERRTSTLEQRREERARTLAELEAELATLNEEAETLDKTERLLQAVSARLLGQSTETVDKLVTAGLRLVFYDLDLTFKTTVDKFRGKTSVRFELFEGGRTAPLTESYGGGVLCVIGVLLRATTIILLKKRRILFLDESLSHLSEQYHEKASELLRKLCDQLHFNILLTTHADSLAEHAHQHLRAKRTIEGTTFEKQGTKDPITP
jgi:DNA repair ATPase RecN